MTTIVPILLLIFFPVVGLFLKLDFHSVAENWNWEILLRVCFFTIKQALASAFFSVALGSLAAVGLNPYSSTSKILRPLFILPNLMSSLLVVLALLTAIPQFPYGFWGIVLGHVYINAGLAALWIGQRYHQIREQFQPAVQVYNIQGYSYFRKIIFPQLLPTLLSSFAVIFSFCMAGFTIPLILGGGPSGATLEVLIYESIKANSDIASSIVFAIVQIGLQLISAYLILFFAKLTPPPGNFASRHLIPNSFATLVTFGICGILTLPFLILIKDALTQWAQTTDILKSPEYAFALKNSIGVALAVATVCFLVASYLLAKGWPQFTTKVPGISSVVLGLGLLLLLSSPPIEFNFQIFLFLVWGHWAILFLPLFRLLAPELQTSRQRFEKVGSHLGISNWTMYLKVYFPICKGVLFSISALAFCWSLGEFAITALIAPAQSTLTLFTQGLLSSYRTEAAVSSSLVLVFVSVVAIVIFEQMSASRGQKS